MGSTQVCYDIEGNIAPCADVIASGASATPLTSSDLANLQSTGGALYVGGAPGTVTALGAPAGSFAGIIGLPDGGGNTSSIAPTSTNTGAQIAAAINSVFGTVYSATNPAKPGQVINPATGQPYSVGQQVQLSGLFSNPLLLILLVVGLIFAFRSGTHRSE